MELAGHLYPWDVVGDPSAPGLYAGLGLDHVVLAAAYHATRAVTPRHPVHRYVTAPHTARYHRRTSPAPGPLAEPQGDPLFEDAAAALRAAGLTVHAWGVVDHIDPWPGATPEFAVENAYGDRYPWALCPSRAAVRERAVRLARDLAALPDVAGVELESCGWFGLDHLHQHDKIQGVPLDAAARRLLAWCFCTGCRVRYRDAGLDADDLRARARAALDPVFAGAPTGGVDADVERAVEAVRGRVAEGLRAEVAAAVRPALPLVLHATPDPRGTTAFTGVDVPSVAPHVDGLVVHCWQNLDELDATRAASAEVPVHASLLAVEGLGGRPSELADRIGAARKAGASGARLYHLGLAGPADLTAIASAVAQARP